MGTKTSNKIRELRRIIGQTQAEFAMMIGASKDTVASWETRRNRLSPEFARRIEFATGADGASLLRRKGAPLGRGFGGRLVPYTRELFDEHAGSKRGRSDEMHARDHARHCAEALELLFVGAAQPVRGERNRLPAVVQSFIQWCEATRKDFKLEKEIDRELQRRRARLEIRHTWGEWRRMQKEDPAMCRRFGFKDDRSKPDRDSLTLEMVIAAVWRPGYPMRGVRQASS